MDKLGDRLKLIPESWYAWQMIPGYIGEHNAPYCSPIFVTRVAPKKTGKGILSLGFVNVFYASGVRDFSLDLRIIKHSKEYLIADLLYGLEGPDRTAIISRIEFTWIERFCPELWSDRPPSSVGGGAESNVSEYLSEVSRLGERYG